jgi:hypothetical protein
MRLAVHVGHMGEKTFLQYSARKTEIKEKIKRRRNGFKGNIILNVFLGHEIMEWFVWFTNGQMPGSCKQGYKHSGFTQCVCLSNF